jgi:hypothetical protein
MVNPIVNDLLQINSLQPANAASLQQCIYQVRMDNVETLVPTLISLLNQTEKVQLQVLPILNKCIHLITSDLATSLTHQLSLLKLSSSVKIKLLSLLIGMSEQSWSIQTLESIFQLLNKLMDTSDSLILSTCLATLQQFISRLLERSKHDGTEASEGGRVNGGVGRQVIEGGEGQAIQGEERTGGEGGDDTMHILLVDFVQLLNSQPTKLIPTFSLPKYQILQLINLFLSANPSESTVRQQVCPAIIKCHGDTLRDEWNGIIALANVVIALHQFNIPLELEILDSIWLKLLDGPWCCISLELWNQLITREIIVEESIPTLVEHVKSFVSAENVTRLPLLSSIEKQGNIPKGYSSNLSLLLLSNLVHFMCINGKDDFMTNLLPILVSGLGFQTPGKTKARILRALMDIASTLPDKSWIHSLPNSIYSTLLLLSAGPMEEEWDEIMKRISQNHFVENDVSEELLQMGVVDERDVVSSLLSRHLLDKSAPSHLSATSSLTVSVCAKTLDRMLKDQTGNIQDLVQLLGKATHHSGTRSIAMDSLSRFVGLLGTASPFEESIPDAFKGLEDDACRVLLELVHEKSSLGNVDWNIIRRIMLNVMPLEQEFDLERFVSVAGVAVSTRRGKTSTRAAFSTLQLYITDFLHSIDPLQGAIDVIGGFCHADDLNTALTSLSLSYSLNSEFSKRSDVNGQAKLVEMLAKFAADPRPEMRSGSLQMLFTCLSILPEPPLQTLIEMVKNVRETEAQVLKFVKGREEGGVSESGFVNAPAEILIGKQWRETVTMLLAGVSKEIKRGKNVEVERAFVKEVQEWLSLDDLVVQTAVKSIAGMDQSRVVLQRWLHEVRAIYSPATIQAVLEGLDSLSPEECKAVLLYNQDKTVSRYNVPIGGDLENMTPLQQTLLDKVTDYPSILEVVMRHGKGGDLHDGNATFVAFGRAVLDRMAKKGQGLSLVSELVKSDHPLSADAVHAMTLLMSNVDSGSDVASILAVVKVRGNLSLVSPEKLCLLDEATLKDFIAWVNVESEALNERGRQYLDVLMSWAGPDSPEALARVVAPILIGRFQKSLKSYAQDREKEGGVALTDPRHDDIVSVLTHLSDSLLHPGILKLSHRDLLHPTKAQLLTTKRAHVFMCLKRVIECAAGGRGVEDVEVGEGVKSVLRIVAEEIGV